MTARHALEALTLEGYLYRHPRRGTFVAEPRLRFSVGSFTRNMTAADRTPGTEVLSAATVEPDAVTAVSARRARRRAGARPATPAHRRGRADRNRGHPVVGGEVPGPARPRPRRLALGALARALRRTSRAARTRASVAVTQDPFKTVRSASRPAAPRSSSRALVYDTEGGVVELARDVYRADRTEFEVSAPVEGVEPLETWPTGEAPPAVSPAARPGVAAPSGPSRRPPRPWCGRP